jgi:hypothetical protein
MSASIKSSSSAVSAGVLSDESKGVLFCLVSFELHKERDQLGFYESWEDSEPKRICAALRSARVAELERALKELTW